MKTSSELVSESSAWEGLQDLIASAKNPVTVLETTAEAGEQALWHIQVSTSSYMGALLYHTGGLLIDGGWVRVLAAGSQNLRSLPSWNMDRTMSAPGQIGGSLLVADDVLGGLFAINGGGLGDDLGNIYYFAPDVLSWEPLDISYTGMIEFLMNGDLSEFYGSERFDGWEKAVQSLSPDEGFSCWPPLWSTEAKDRQKISRKAVNMNELFDLMVAAG